MWNVGLLWSQWSWIGLHLKLICGTPSYFRFLWWPQCPSRLWQCSWGLFGVPSSKSRLLTCLMDNMELLCAIQGNWASSRCEGDGLWFFSSCGGNLGYILKLRPEWPFRTHVCSATLRLLSSYEGHLRNLQQEWQGNMDVSWGEAGDPGSLSSFHSDIGIPINFQEVSGIVTFWSIELRVPLEVSKDMSPPVQVRRGPKAFSRVSTGDSDIPSCS